MSKMWTERSNKLKLLAIDQAFRHSGFAFFENGKYKEHGSYIVDKDDDKKVKYDKFIDVIKGLLDELKPDCVITEMPWCGPNKKVYSLLSELVGVMRCCAFTSGIKFEVVPIASYRSAAGVKNKKVAVTKFIKEKYPDLTFKNDDESDACCLCLGYIKMIEGENNGKTK